MKSWWYILLIITYIATLWVPFYASKDPVLFGIPYFYWYQFLWVVISAVLTGIVYVATKKSKKGAFLLEGFSGN